MSQKQQNGLINYFTNVIIRPHRQIYTTDKLGLSKTVVKSQEKCFADIQRILARNQTVQLSKEKNYCQLIEVNRKDITVKRSGKNIEVSIYEPQLTHNSPNHESKGRNHSSNKPRDSYSNPNIRNDVFYENCVVFLHANSGSRLQANQYVKFVLQYRTPCVSFDYIGSGLSDGDHTTMGVNESEDLSAVLKHIVSAYRVKRFSLWGRSMGAVTGLYYLMHQYKNDASLFSVTACILDSPFCSLERLILELASKKSTLPQFLFMPILKMIEKNIIEMLGYNILEELNLCQKIQNLESSEAKLLSKVRFLGVASKQDKMISHEHVEKLCNLLNAKIPKVKSEEKTILSCSQHSASNKHLKCLIDYRREINCKGDILYIQGDHNIPRSNTMKEKASLFIHESFSQFDRASIPHKPSSNGTINFGGKTGKPTKTKLSFTKLRKDSFQEKQSGKNQQNNIQYDDIKEKHSITNRIVQQKLGRHNYNNLNQINASYQNHNHNCQKTQRKSSLSKKIIKENKKPAIFEQIKQKGFVQNRNIFLAPDQKIKTEYTALEENPKQRNSQKSVFNGFFNGIPKSISKAIYESPKSYLSISPPPMAQNCDNFDETSLLQVNNSANKNERNSLKSDSIQMARLNLSENCQVISSSQSLCHRENKTDREKIMAQNSLGLRVPRESQAIKHKSSNRYQKKQQVNTNPFDLSIDRTIQSSHQLQNSFQQESFRKKEPARAEYASRQQTALQMGKSPAQNQKSSCKVSVSEFSRTQQKDRDIGKKSLINGKRKQNNFASANVAVKIQQQKFQQRNMISANQGDMSISEYSTDSLQFRGRNSTQTNNSNTNGSFQKSDISITDSIGSKDNLRVNNNRCQMSRGSGHNSSMIDSRSPQLQNQHYGVNMSFQQIRNNHNPTPNQTSNLPSPGPYGQLQSPPTLYMKQFLIRSGHTGLTQSSTFASSNQQDGNGEHRATLGSDQVVNRSIQLGEHYHRQAHHHHKHSDQQEQQRSEYSDWSQQECCYPSLSYPHKFSQVHQYTQSSSQPNSEHYHSNNPNHQQSKYNPKLAQRNKPNNGSKKSLANKSRSSKTNHTNKNNHRPPINGKPNQRSQKQKYNNSISHCPYQHHNQLQPHNNMIQSNPSQQQQFHQQNNGQQQQHHVLQYRNKITKLLD